MRTIVLSLGGSLIIPEKINFKFLDKFKKTLRKHYKTHKFIIVTGGGAIARKYISALEQERKSSKELAMAGIRAGRMNAIFMMQFFGKEANETLPLDMREVKSRLGKHRVVICGALRYAPNETSDGTAAKLAHFLKTPFINLTNVKGLYTADPKKDKNAKFISKISWQEFAQIVGKIKFKAGQHFVLDQQASKVIKKHKIQTYIIGPDLKNLEKILKNKDFTGTLIEG